MAFIITSDSTCDLGPYAQERDIVVLPLQVHLDSASYYDGVDIQPQDIFDFVAKTKILPKTSAPSIGEYEEFFAKQLQNADGVLHFNISSKCSGSCSFARAAAESFGGKVRVIDSEALSSGQGLLVMKAADLRDAGKTIDEVEQEINQVKKHVNTSFVPDTLDYLHKGGRVSGMVKVAAGMFKIHPLIYMQGGALIPGKKYRGKMTMCIDRYAEDLKELYPSYDKTRCFVTHSCASKELVDLAKAKVKELFDFDEILETTAGSIVTSHCGQGTLGILFIYEE